MALQWYYRLGGTGSGLTQAQQDNNIKCVYGCLNSYGWSKEAIAGACGCMLAESGYNPGIYESSSGGTINNLPYFPGGMGLCQWTDYPAYSGTYPNPLPFHAQQEGKNWWDGSFQCWLMTKANDSSYTPMGYGQGPRWGWSERSAYPVNMSFNTYIHTSSYSIEDMVRCWYYCFESHYAAGDPGSIRLNAGVHAYNLIKNLTPEIPEGYIDGGGGTDPEPPTPTTPKRGNAWWCPKSSWCDTCGFEKLCGKELQCTEFLKTEV